MSLANPRASPLSKSVMPALALSSYILSAFKTNHCIHQPVNSISVPCPNVSSKEHFDAHSSAWGAQSSISRFSDIEDSKVSNILTSQSLSNKGVHFHLQTIDVQLGSNPSHSSSTSLTLPIRPKLRQPS